MGINLNETFSTRDGRFYPITLNGELLHYPSVTTILDMVRVKGHLDKWEAELIEFIGVDGHKKYMQKKADEGTAVHNLIEYYLKERQDKKPFPMDRYNIEGMTIAWDGNRMMTTKDVNDYSWEKFIRWVGWWKQEMLPSKPELIWTEKKLVSHKHGIAGRSDALFKIGTAFWIYDWKSGKSSDKHKFQCAAYCKMDQEESGRYIAGSRILTLGEETKSGWKLSEVSSFDKHKNSAAGETETDYYFNGFLKTKEVVDWHCPKFGPNNKTLPRHILPQ